MLTEAQKTACRRYCGWPDRFLDHDSAMERALQAAGDKPSTEDVIVDLLGHLDVLDAALRDSGVRLRLQALQVGKTQLTGGGEIDRLRGEGRRYSAQLASILSIEIRNDAWSEASPTYTSGYGGMTGSGGGEIPFG